MRLINKSDYWPCACFRYPRGKPTQVKFHHPSVKRCKTCKMKQPTETDLKAAEAEIEKRKP